MSFPGFVAEASLDGSQAYIGDWRRRQVAAQVVPQIATSPCQIIRQTVDTSDSGNCATSRTLIGCGSFFKGYTQFYNCTSTVCDFGGAISQSVSCF